MRILQVATLLRALPTLAALAWVRLVQGEAAVIEVRVVPPAADTVKITLEAKTLDGRGEPHSQALDVAPGKNSEARLPEGSGWMVQAAAQGYWSPTVTVASPQKSQLTLYRTCKVSGKITGITKPEFAARLESAPGKGTPPTKELFRCALEEGGAFECDLPSGSWGFSLRMRGGAPLYVFEKSLAPGGKIDVGSVAFVPGASISGRVTADSREWNPTGARVYLRPAAKPSPLSLAPAASVAASGFFQLKEVRPGSYQVLVAQPGYSDDVRVVEVVQDLEAILTTPLLLGEPCELAVVIEPPVGPDGAPWQVEIRDSTAPGPTFVRARGTAHAGRFHWRGLRAGQKYWIGLRSSMGLRWSDEDESFVAVAPVVEKLIHATVERTSGTVLLAGRPLKARLTFGIDSNVKIEMASKGDGAFEGFLPRLGKWRVRISSDEPDVNRDVGVEVVRGSEGGGRAEILLDDFELRGVLVDEKEAPFQFPAFLSIRDGKSTEQHEVKDGQFRVRGLMPGEYSLFAEGNAYQSDAQTTTLRRDEESDPVRLVMKRKRSLAVRILEPGGAPAVQFPVLLIVADPRFRVQGSRVRITDASGRMVFTEVGPEETERCLVLYSVPRQLPAKIMRVPIGPEEIAIQLDAFGGTIVSNTRSTSTNDPWLLHEGCSIRRSYLTQGGLSDFPAFSPGLYSLCPSATWQLGPQCVSGVLEPLKTLELNLRNAPGAGSGENRG